MIRYHQPALGPAGRPRRHGSGDAHRLTDARAPLALPAGGTIPEANPRARQRWQAEPDSIMSRLVAAVLEATRACGHALERHQVHEAYTARHASPVVGRRHLDTALRTLVGQGRLVRTVGRPGSYGYHHPEHRVPEAPLAQEVERLVATVARMYAELGRPVPTHELGREMRQEAGVAHDYALFDHLLMQLTQSRGVGATRWRQPVLDLVTPPTTFGVRVRFWAPAGHERRRRELERLRADSTEREHVQRQPDTVAASRHDDAASEDSSTELQQRTTASQLQAVEARPGDHSDDDREMAAEEPLSEPSPSPGNTPAATDGGVPHVSAAHSSRAEALREAVELAEDALGRPVSRAELSWWCRAHPDNAAAAATKWGRGRRPFRDTTRRDAFFPGRIGRMRTIANDMTCSGGAPLRYGLWRSTSPLVGELSTVLEDLCSTLSPAAELDGVAELESWHRHTRSDLVATMMRLRQDALTRATVERLSRWVASITDDHDRARMLVAPTAHTAIADALDISANAITVMRRWVGSVPATPEERTRVRQVLDERERNIDALRPLIAPWWTAHLAHLAAAAHAARPVPETMVAVDAHGVRRCATMIGESSLVPIAWLRPFCDHLAQAGGYDAVKYRYNFTKPMRRYRALVNPATTTPPTTSPRPLYRRAQSQPGHLDRVDALTRAFRINGVPRARMLVDGAARILGYVIRDVALTAMLQQECRDTGEQRLLLIAMGLLGDLDGVVAAVGSLVCGHSTGERAVDASDARAVALALTCAAPADAPRLLAAIEAEWPAPTRSVFAAATMRLHAGCVQGVIE